MALFNEEQLKELETVFGLKRVQDVLPVRDGVVDKNTLVWWRNAEGPEHVIAGTHWQNIHDFPKLYQLTEPQTKTTYLD